MVLHVLAWVVIAVLAVAATTASFGVSSRKVLALAHDALPYLLVLAWPILVVAVIERQWPLALCAAAVVLFHVGLLVPRIRADHVPRWVASAPRFDLVVANVYVDNESPDVMAQQLVASGADVIVVAEWNDEFASAFEAAGAGDAYPHRLCNDSDDPDYVVTIASREPFAPTSCVVDVGDLPVTSAVVDCGGRSVTILAVHPTAAVDPGGYERWKGQIDALIRYIPTVTAPFVLAGDFNSTRFRPEFQSLLATGLTDAHDALGRGLTTSFRLATEGALAAAGTVVRLDHALLSDGVWPVSARDLDACGSDHVPFRLTLAVRPSTRVDAVVGRVAAMSRSET